jgi:hypothetical protein
MIINGGTPTSGPRRIADPPPAPVRRCPNTPASTGPGSTHTRPETACQQRRLTGSRTSSSASAASWRSLGYEAGRTRLGYPQRHVQSRSGEWSGRCSLRFNRRFLATSPWSCSRVRSQRFIRNGLSQLLRLPIPVRQLANCQKGSEYAERGYADSRKWHFRHSGRDSSVAPKRGQ